MKCILVSQDRVGSGYRKNVAQGPRLILKARLHREWLVQEFLVEGLFGLMHHDDSNTMTVILWPPSPAHHLQHVCDGKVHISPAHAAFLSAPQRQVGGGGGGGVVQPPP